MFKGINKLLIAVLLTTVLLGGIGQGLFAQPNAIQVAGVETQILPEYDTRDILVINTIRIQNTSDSEYTGDLRWIVPDGSKTHIIIDNNDKDNYLQFSLVENNGNSELVWKLNNPLKAGETRSIHLEFYYNNFEGAVDKSFSVEFVQPYNIVDGQIFVFQPTKATNFKLTPEPGPPQTGQFIYYQKGYSNLVPGEKINLAVSYTKSDPNPSVLAPPNSYSDQSQNQTQGSNTPSNNLLGKNTGILIIAGLCVIVVLLVAKIIINNRKLEGLSGYESDNEIDEDDDDVEDDEDVDDEDEDEDEGEESTNDSKRSTRQAALDIEKAYKAGRITEEEYLLKLDELRAK